MTLIPLCPQKANTTERKMDPAHIIQKKDDALRLALMVLEQHDKANVLISSNGPTIRTIISTAIEMKP